MKQFIILLILLFNLQIYGQVEVSGRMNIMSSDTTLNILLQLNTNTGIDGLGGATIPISYYNIQLLDYTYYNFSGGTYYPATVTTPIPDFLWLNIYNGYDNPGTIIPDWTDIVTLRFRILDINKSIRINWEPDNMYWAIYDGNNIDKWTSVTFTGISIISSVEPDIPIEDELGLDHPNPSDPTIFWVLVAVLVTVLSWIIAII